MLTVTEPIVGFQSVVVHTMHTPVQMLLQGRIKGVSLQRLARWLADIQARDITTVNSCILPHLLGDVEGHPHTCQTKEETQSPVHNRKLPNQTQVYIDGSRYWHDGQFHTGCAVWTPHSPNSDTHYQQTRLLKKLNLLHCWKLLEHTVNRCVCTLIAGMCLGQYMILWLSGNCESFLHLPVHQSNISTS